MQTFIFTEYNYKNDLLAYVSSLEEHVKSGEVTASQAIDITQAMTDAYVEQVGERPDNAVLYRLGTILLNNIYTDTYKYKAIREEYPILSPSQLDKRYQSEVGSGWYNSVGTDGIDYRISTRDNNRYRNERLR